MRLARIAREPIFHFLLLGALLFGVHAFLKARAPEQAATITITSGQIVTLAASFERTWHRPPTPPELEDLIEGRVREEVYCREAMALGLDQDDPIIRRRLEQKMRFICEDLSSMAPPTEAELAEYFAAHAAEFSDELRVTLTQVYVNPTRHGDALAGRLAQLEQELGASVDASALGDPTLLPSEFATTPISELAALFGEGLAARVAELPIGAWEGPISSGVGLHFVHVRERHASPAPQLSDVREDVQRALEDERRQAANQEIYDRLRARYTIAIERPPTPSPEGPR